MLSYKKREKSFNLSNALDTMIYIVLYFYNIAWAY